MDKPLISIIVPVYKVEEYLDVCVESIVRQTYENLEIILVDDGSPDRSGEICDVWARKDARIRVIHKENAGASTARNAGLDTARGEYVGFVDSDDYIAPNMYEILYGALMDTDKKMVSCSSMAVTQSHPVACVSATNEKRIYDTKQALDGIFRGEIGTAFWRKLYHRSIFSEIRFPEREVNEEYPLLVPTVLLSRGIVLVPDVLYFYRQREGSVTTSGFLTPDRSGIVLKNLNRIRTQIADNRLDVEKSFRLFAAYQSYYMAVGMEKQYPALAETVRKDYCAYRKIMWENMVPFLRSKQVLLKNKVLYMLVLLRLLRHIQRLMNR